MTYQLPYRIAVLSFIKNGGSKAEASRIFQISRHTIYVWLKLENLSPKPPLKTRHRKINKAALQRHVEENPDMFLHERAIIFGVGSSAISYSLKRMNIVKKRKNDT